LAHVKKGLEDRVLNVIGAWDRKCPGKRFYSFTLTEFKERAKPFLDAIGEITRLEAELAHAVSRRDAEGRLLLPDLQGVVNAVKGDREEGGENGELYAAMGYVPKGERATGLVRRRKAQTPGEVSS
jgi:hypothetical protein